MASAQYDKLHLYIDGEWLGPEGRKTGNVVNPATGDTIGTLPHASKADLDRALDAAARGFQSWRKVSPNERAKILRKAGELIRERAERIATLMTLEEGKTLGEICAQIKDPARNGSRSLEALVEHIGEDHLVGWAWAPGYGRQPAPGTQKEAGALVEAWVKTGAVCPN